jgi:hypothetical protein
MTSPEKPVKIKRGCIKSMPRENHLDFPIKNTGKKLGAVLFDTAPDILLAGLNYFFARVSFTSSAGTISSRNV